MKLKCQNCKWKWDYNGNNPYYAYCPHCHHLVSLKKQKVKITVELDKKIQLCKEPERVRPIDEEDELITNEKGEETNEQEEFEEFSLNGKVKQTISEQQPKCCNCGSTSDLINLNGMEVCRSCYNSLKENTSLTTSF